MKRFNVIMIEGIVGEKLNVADEVKFNIYGDDIFIKVIATGNLATNCKHLKDGTRVLVTGKLNKINDNYIITANEINFIGK
jgi:hypothetical protein